MPHPTQAMNRGLASNLLLLLRCSCAHIFSSKMASVEEEYDIIDKGEIHRIMQEGNQKDDATSQIIVEAETDCIENTAVYAILRLCDIAKPILLDQWREGKLCCPVCLDNQVFYTIPDGLKHHVSVARHKRVSDDLLQDAKRISRASVCQETLENIMKLSSARQHADPFGRLYMKCVVTSDGEQEVVINATREKEAAKLYCLYLQQMGKLSNIKEREKFCPVSIKSQKLEIKFMAWTSSSKIHLETCFSRMVSFRPRLSWFSLSYLFIVIFEKQTLPASYKCFFKM